MAFVSPCLSHSSVFHAATNQCHVQPFAFRQVRLARPPLLHHILRAVRDSPSPTGLKQWFQAARFGDVAAMTKLVRAGEVTTALVQDEETQKTALHVAAAESDATTVRALFELARGVGGAKQDFAHRTTDALRLMNMADAQGDTPLHIAAARSDENSVAVVETLLSLGADASLTNEQGATAAQVASDRVARIL